MYGYENAQGPVGLADDDFVTAYLNNAPAGGYSTRLTNGRLEVTSHDGERMIAAFTRLGNA